MIFVIETLKQYSQKSPCPLEGIMSGREIRQNEGTVEQHDSPLIAPNVAMKESEWNQRQLVSSGPVAEEIG